MSKPPRQTQIPNTGRIDGVPAIDKLANKLCTTLAELKDLNETKAGQTEDLAELMREHGLHTYVFVDRETNKRRRLVLNDKFTITIKESSTSGKPKEGVSVADGN